MSRNETVVDELKWAYEGRSRESGRHMFTRQWSGKATGSAYSTFYRWIEAEIGVEGEGWLLNGTTRVLIVSDEHALSFRMRWC